MSRFKKKATLEKYIKLYDDYKTKYDKIALLYELGSFYEIYGVDNEIEKLGNIDQICEDLPLTKSRANKKILKNSRDNPLQAGFPSHSLDSFIQKFIKCNYTVIVYSQYGNEQKIRKLDKIVSRGTYIENIDEDDSVNLISLYAESFKETLEINMMVLDLTTGKNIGYSIGGQREETIKKISRILHTTYKPKEIIIIGDENLEKELEIENFSIHKKEINKTFLKTSYQNEFFGKVFPNYGSLTPIEYINMEKYPSLIICFIILLNFANEHDESIIKNITRPIIRNVSQYVNLTHRTIYQLNLIQTEDPKNKSLFDIINKTSTPGGKRLLKQRLACPITSVDQLKDRYEDIENMDFKKFEPYLKNIGDLDRLHRKLFLKKLSPLEFSFLDQSYSNILLILNCKDIPCQKNINKTTIGYFKHLIKFYKQYLDIEIMEKYNLDNITEPIFKQGLYADIDEANYELKNSWEKLNGLVSELSRHIDDKEDLIKVGNTATEGYFLTTTKNRFNGFLKKLTEYKFEVKTQTSYVKIFNSEIKKYSSSILSSMNKLCTLNKEKFIDLLDKITIKYQIHLKNISNYVSHVDVIKSNAKVAQLYNYCKPKIEYSNDSFVDIKNLRHPIIERINENEDFVANDLKLGKDTKGILLYGINSSGKSILLKSVGISVILAQAGLYVPAESFTFSPYKTIISKISMIDDLYKGQSTFTCEMIDLRYMLECGNENSLILADELCSGTETNSAISLVSASIFSLSRKNASFLFTTHLHQLVKIQTIQNLSNISFNHLSIDIKNGKLTYNRKLQNGSGSDSYGIEIAKQLNVGDESFMKFAIDIRRNITKSQTDILTTKQSRYNKNLYMDKCENCEETDKSKLHTHHIQHQADADENGMINGNHKNKKSNLKVLCIKCHSDIHDHE